MKLLLLCIPISFAMGFPDNHIQKRGFFSYLGSFRGQNLGSKLSGSSRSANHNSVIDPAVLGSTASKNADNILFLKAALPHFDRLLSTKNFEQAFFFLGILGDISPIYNDLVKLAVKKGDTQFLISVINSKPRSVLGDLNLMKYVRETSNPERANHLSSIIANNIGDTHQIGNTGTKRYYDVWGDVFPAEKAKTLAVKFFNAAATEADRKIWQEIIRDIQMYAID